MNYYLSPSVELDILESEEILSNESYFGDPTLAKKFIETILEKCYSKISPIANLKAPNKSWLKKYGAPLYWVKWRNHQTVWYCFYLLKGDDVLVTYITNNHKDGRRLRVKIT